MNYPSAFRRWHLLGLGVLLSSAFVAAGDSISESPSGTSAGVPRVSLVRIAPPPLKFANAASQAAVLPSPEEEAIARRREGKRGEVFWFSATVRSTELTEVEWWAYGRTWRAWSSVDFRHFAQISEVETETAVFTLLGAIADGRGEEATFPSEVRPDARRSEFVVDCTAAEMEKFPHAFEAIEALHGYFAANRGALLEATAKREAETAKRIAAPPAPPAAPATVRYWRSK